MLQVTLFNLLYVDDAILLARTWRSMQQHLYALQSFCQEYKLRLNLKKTQILIFQPKRVPIPALSYMGCDVIQAERYKYLGIYITDTLNWSNGILHRICAGWNAWFHVENLCRRVEIWDWHRKWQLFEVIVIPTLLYGCEIWGPSISRETWQKVERVQKRFFTNYMGVKSTTPYLLLLEEAGQPMLECRALEKTIAYVRKIEAFSSCRLPLMAKQVSTQAQRLKKGWWKDLMGWMERWHITWDDIPQQKQERKSFLHKKTMDTT